MYLYMHCFLETKSGALCAEGDLRRIKKGCRSKRHPLNIKLHSLALPIWIWIGIRGGETKFYPLLHTPLTDCPIYL